MRNAPSITISMGLVAMLTACEGRESASSAEAKSDRKGRASEASPSEASPREASPNPKPVPELAPAPPRSFGPNDSGPAYFAVHPEGLVMFDGEAFVPVEGDSARRVSEIEHARDGRVYALGGDGILRLDGSRATRVAKVGIGSDVGVVSSLSVTEQGELWVVGNKGVSHGTDGAWTTYGTDFLELGAFNLGIEVDAHGRIWVSTSKSLHVREAEAESWVEVDIMQTSGGPPRRGIHGSLELGPGGTAYMITSAALIKLDAPDSLETVVSAKPLTNLHHMGVCATGIIGFASGDDLVSRVSTDGTRTDYVVADEDFTPKRTYDVAPDEAGRLWLTTDVGVVIVGPADERIEWKAGTVDALSADVFEIGVIGRGPTVKTE